MSTEQPRERQFIVVWDDEQGICVAMSWDAECDGAICAMSPREKVALFGSREAARTAIRISTKWAELLQAQGKPANTDFLEGRKNLRILECQPEGKP